MPDYPGSVTRGRTAVVGIGETPMYKASPDTAPKMAVDASLAALADAGVEPGEVDGLLRFAGPFETVGHAAMVRNLGIRELSYYGEIPLGGEGAAGMIHHAVGALTSGRASVVLAYRAIKQSGGNRMGRADRGRAIDEDTYVEGENVFTWPYWMMAPAHLFALWATRYMHEAGITEAQFREAAGRIALDQRHYANARPTALMHGRLMTREDFEAARMISWPLNLFMLCLENDGAAAVVMTTVERAADLKGIAVPVLGSSQSLAWRKEPFSLYSEDLLQIFPPANAERLWAESGITPAEVKVAEIYDASLIFTLLSLELFGFTERNRAWEHVVNHGIGLDSPLPVNTHGGHLSDGYIHGMSGILEAVKQVRGTAINQVPDVDVSFFGAVSGSSAVFSSLERAAASRGEP